MQPYYKLNFREVFKKKKKVEPRVEIVDGVLFFYS